MSTRIDARLVDLEARMTVLHSRVMRLEREAGLVGAASVAPARQMTAPAPPATPAPPTGASVPVAPRRAAAPAPRPRPDATLPAMPDLEEVLGGRVLAWLGGAAVVLGLAFFFALAISRGWIGEAERTLIAAAASTAILAAGIWLRERRGRNEAAMAAAASGLAGLFLTVVVATRMYDLVPAVPGIVLALCIGAGASFLALRWSAPVIGGIGTLGAAISPALAGAPQDATTIALLFVATAAGAVVLVYRRWDALGLALFAVSAPQWLPWVTEHATPAQAVMALAGFGLAGMVAAIGLELRSGSSELRQSAAFLFAANSIVIAVAGWIAFTGAHEPALAKVWIGGLAALHAMVGGSTRREGRLSEGLRVLALGLGVVLADVAWGTLVDGPGVALGWALSAIGFAWAAGHEKLGHAERQAALLGLGGQITIALVRILASDTPPASAIAGVPSPDGLVAVASLAAACLISARLAEERANVRVVLNGFGLASIAYFTIVALDGPALVVALAIQACGLAAVAYARGDSFAGGAALAFLGAAALHSLAIEAPPRAFLYGAPSMSGMVIALAAVGLAMARIGLTGGVPVPWPRLLKLGAAAIALYAASVAIVTGFQPGAAEATTLLDLGVRQQGQMFVSALWSLTGAAGLVVGLTRSSRVVRLAGLALLGAAVAKVFVFDLATLTSVYRVISFIGLGLVLLGGAYAWQRMRPVPLPDLREAS
jgi:uncharacterized membrane protein